MPEIKNLLWIVIFFSTIIFSCESADPIIENGELTLTQVDNSCTEAWFKLNLPLCGVGRELELRVNDESCNQATVNSAGDTLLVVEGLLPSKSYKIGAILHGKGNYKTISAEINAETMDTTSGDFTWQSRTFGSNTGGSSLFDDVAIVDENNIWAVGDIQEEGVRYNAAHWNGIEWELKRILYYADCNQPDGHKFPDAADAVFALNGNILISSGIELATLTTPNDYEIQCIYDIEGERFTIFNIWGVNNSDYYLAGWQGNIAHYNGSEWRKIETILSSSQGGEGNDIHNLWGAENILTGKRELYFSVPRTRGVYMLDDNENLNQLEINDNRFYRGVWTKNSLIKYVTGAGVVKNIDNEWQIDLEENGFFYEEIDGEDHNSIVAAGSFGGIVYYNGTRWIEFPGLHNSLVFYERVSIKDDIIVAVGLIEINQIKGFITIGIRN